MTHVARALTAAALLAAVACKGRDNAPAAGAESGTTATATAQRCEPRVLNLGACRAVRPGRHRIGENKMVTEPTFQFAPKDTVYLSVSTEGARESAELRAVWRFQTGQTVDSSSQTISPQGDENTEFHVSNPKGWPVGTYNVTVYANGDSVDSKNFAVKK